MTTFDDVQRFRGVASFAERIPGFKFTRFKLSRNGFERLFTHFTESRQHPKDALIPVVFQQGRQWTQHTVKFLSTEF